MEVLDTVATLKSIAAERLTLVEPEYKFITSLPVGLVGTAIEVYGNGESSKYLV